MSETREQGRTPRQLAARVAAIPADPKDRDGYRPDNMARRRALVEALDAGKISLAEAQAALRHLKRMG